MKKSLFINVLFLMLAFSIQQASSSFAQITIPGSVDPGRVERIIQEREIQRSREDGVQSAPRSTSPVLTSVPEEFQKVKIKFNGFRLSGFTVYNQKKIEDLYRNKIGREQSLAEIYALADLVTDMYRKDGYILAQATLPPQEIIDGMLNMQIVEGYVENVDISLDKSLIDNPLISKMSLKLKELDPFNINLLERYVLLMNELPGVRAEAILVPATADPGQLRPGAVGIKILARTVPSQSSLTVDSFGSRYAGPYQTSVRLVADNAFTKNSQIIIYGLNTIPVSELTYASASFLQKLTEEGTTGTFSVAATRAAPGYKLRSLDVRSASINYTASLTHAFLRSRALNFFGGLDFSIKNASSDFLSADLYNDRLRVARLTFNIDSVDSWGGVNYIDSSIARGLDTMGASGIGVPRLSRADGRSDFLKVESTFSRLQQMPADTQLMLSISGQYANKPLLSMEEFGVGGQSFGRAYDTAEITGDRGTAFSVEFRLPSSVPVQDLAIQPYVFWDIGKVWNIDNNNTTSQSLSSTGFGGRFNFYDTVSGNITVAVPLTKTADSPIWGNGNGPRALFSLSKRF